MLTAILIYLLAAFFGYAFILCLRRISEPKVSYLAFMVATFIACNCFALALPISLLDDLSGYNMEPEWLLRAAFGYVPLVMLTVLYLYWFGLRKPQSNLGEASRPELSLTKPGSYLAVGLMFLLCLIVLRYIYLAGLEKIYAWTNIIDRASNYEARSYYVDINNQGEFSSLLAANCLIPLLAGLVMFYGTIWSFPMRVMLTLPPLLLALIQSLSTLQRGPPLMLLLVIALLYAASFASFRHFWQNIKRLVAARIFILVSGIFFLAGVFIYQRSDKTANSAYRLIERMFIVPSDSAALYFGVFPNPLDFRGFLGTFYMPVGSFGAYQSEPTSILLVGFTGNGYAHCANANYIATAYSGMGWTSVILITVLMFAFFVIWSRFLGRFGHKMSLLFIITQLPCSLVLESADVTAAVSFGFLLGPAVLWLFVRPPWMKRIVQQRRKRTISVPIQESDPGLVD